MTNRAPIAEPIAKFFKSPRGRRGHARVDLSEYEGHPLVNVRIWQTGSDGIDRPTVKGVSLGIRKLPELASALAKAETKARELGLLDDQDEGAST
jgi:Transcriptional Coactivator p15 (PC4)